jgi:hypothetical protein
MADSNVETPGLWSRTYVADRYFLQPPAHQITETVFEAATRTSNGTMRMDRLAGPDGFPNRMRRFSVNFSFKNVGNRSQTEFLSRLEAVGQPFDFAVFKQTHDVWDGDAETVDFYLNHRCGVPGLVTPQQPFSEYTLRVIRWSGPCALFGSTPTELTVVSKTNADIDTSTPGADEAWLNTDPLMVSGRLTSRIRLGTAPPDAFDCLEAIYVPYLSGVITQKSPRQYQEAGMEPRSYTIEEFG